ncbi:putative transposase-associated domain-containing protein [Tanacetum coccineum]
MDKSWMETNRISKSYVDGVVAFTDYAVHNLQKTGNIDPRVNKKHIYIPCPCTKCLNHIEHKVEEVQYHLYRHGIDISYTKWTKHGEEDEPSISAPKPVNATTEFVDDMDFAYIPTDGPATVEMVNATKDNFDVDDLVKFQELLLDAEKPLYEGCPDFTKLSAIVKLLNLKGKYGASDKFFTELLGLIKKMLPAGNEMVEKTYQAKKVMRLMGSGYKKIHVCINNCLLYWKNDKDLTACRTCGTSRWKVDNKTKKVYENIPAKVMWYFPIIPRLQRLFKIESISEDLRWHATRRITDGVLRHPADSQAWRTIDEKFPITRSIFVNNNYIHPHTPKSYSSIRILGVVWLSLWRWLWIAYKRGVSHTVENGDRGYFSRKEIEEKSPFRSDGIDLKKETYLRKSYCMFLQYLRIRLKVDWEMLVRVGSEGVCIRLKRVAKTTDSLQIGVGMQLTYIGSHEKQYFIMQKKIYMENKVYKCQNLKRVT